MRRKPDRDFSRREGDGDMAKQSFRRFTILELLFLIAAIAVGFAWSGYYQRYVNWEGFGEPTRKNQVFWAGVAMTANWVWGMPSFLTVVTIAVLILRLRERPRKRLRDLARLPGTVASGAAMLAVSLDILHEDVDTIIHIFREYDDGNWSFWQLTFLGYSGHDAGQAVIVAWALLAASGRWRREPGWLDGVGIAIGALWIIQPIVAEILGRLDGPLGHLFIAR